MWFSRSRNGGPATKAVEAVNVVVASGPGGCAGGAVPVFGHSGGVSPSSIPPAPPEVDQETLEAEWRKEWLAARDHAVSKVRMPEEKVRIVQDDETGWWHVEKPKRYVEPPRFEDTYEYRRFYCYPSFPSEKRTQMQKPSMEVRASIEWSRYEPKFTTYAEAEEWAKVTVLLGPQKIGLRKDGTPTNASLAIVASMIESQKQDAEQAAKRDVRDKAYEAEAQF